MKDLLVVALMSGLLAPGWGHAQQPSAYQGNVGDWALGRWDGNIVSIGTSNGTAGLSRESRHLIVQRTMPVR
jgi:hypothetical protein